MGFNSGFKGLTKILVVQEIIIITIIIIINATTSKSLTQYLSNTPGKNEIKELQKTAIFGTAHILREALMPKYKKVILGNNIACSTNCRYRIAATLYTLETCFVSGI